MAPAVLWTVSEGLCRRLDDLDNNNWITSKHAQSYLPTFLQTYKVHGHEGEYNFFEL